MFYIELYHNKNKHKKKNHAAENQTKWLETHGPDSTPNKQAVWNGLGTIPSAQGKPLCTWPNPRHLPSSGRVSTLNTHWKDWCWSWSSNTLATWCDEPTHWKRPWCWERVRAGEGGHRGWDGWMASLTRWTWVWTSSRRWWRTGRPGVLQSIGSQSRTGLSHWTRMTETKYEFRLRGET